MSLRSLVTHCTSTHVPKSTAQAENVKVSDGVIHVTILTKDYHTIFYHPLIPLS